MAGPLDDLLNADLTGAGVQNTELGEFGGKIGKYVGVPDGYRTLGQDPRDDTLSGTRRARYNDTGMVGVPEKQLPRYDEASYNQRIATLSDSPEDVWRLQQKLAQAGLIGPKTRFRAGELDNTTRNAYRQLITFANVNGVDEEQAYLRLANAPSGTFEGGFGADGGGGGAEAPFTGTKKRTSKSINLTDPTSAQSAMRKLLRNELGRAPRPEEVAAFVGALNGAERANASVTTTTDTFSAGEQTASSSVTSGGLDAGAFSEEYIEKTPELATERNTFRVATDYYNAAMSVLGEGGT